MVQSIASQAFAILQLDLVGYSRLVGTDDEMIVRAIDKEMIAVRGILEGHGGTIRGRAGDSYLATLPTVRIALQAAFKIQNRVAEQSSSNSLLFRVGVHVGDVFVNGDEVIGNAVNIAARLEGFAEPGGVCISRATYDLATPADRARFTRHGEVRLKNIVSAVEVFMSRPNKKTHATVRAHVGALSQRSVTRPKILVRPFVALSNDPRTSCLASGFTADLISRLSRFRHLDVIGRESSFALNAQTVDQAAADQVDARYVAGGQFQLVDNRLRASVLLADAESGRIIWAERFDRKLDDFFEVQTEIEELATSAMAVVIELAEREAARARDPNSLDAYSLVVSGRLENLMDGETGEEATARAMSCFSKAANHDPYYAAALAGIARTHTVQWLCNWTNDRDQSMEASTTYALKAIEADVNDAMSHFSLGFVSLYRREHDRSLAAYEHAMRLNPSDVEIIADYADALKHSGEPKKAIPFFERALALNPLRPDQYLSNLAHAYMVLGDFEEAVATIRQMRQPLTAQRTLTASLMLAGREREGRQEAARLRALESDFSAVEWCKMVPDRLPEHNEIFREGLERAGF